MRDTNMRSKGRPARLSNPSASPESRVTPATSPPVTRNRRPRTQGDWKRPSSLSIAGPPPAYHPLSGHTDTVLKVVSVPESGVIATVCNSDSHLRIFPCTAATRGAAVRVVENILGEGADCIAALGGGVIALGGNETCVSTCAASTGDLLETLRLCTGRGSGFLVCLAAVGRGLFAVGTRGGALIFVQHTAGRGMQQVEVVKAKHTNAIFSIAARGGVVVTASYDGTAGVWSAVTRERVAVLKGHRESVTCAAISDGLIATGSDDGTIRCFKNGGSYALRHVLDGTHRQHFWTIKFVTDDMLLSASFDNTVAFTSIRTGKPLARMSTGISILGAAVLADGRLACVGEKGKAALISMPAVVADDVKKYALTLLPSAAQSSSPDGNDDVIVIDDSEHDDDDDDDDASDGPSRGNDAAAILSPPPPAKKRHLKQEDEEAGVDLDESTAAVEPAAGAPSSALLAPLPTKKRRQQPEEEVTAVNLNDRSGELKAAAGPAAGAPSSAVVAPPPAKKRRQQQEDEAECAAVNFGELKIAAYDARAISKMSQQALSTMLAAVLYDFENYYRPRLSLLSDCLKRMLQRTTFGADSLLRLPEKNFVKAVVDELRRDKIYCNLGEVVTNNLEERFGHYVGVLRGASASA